jgi:transposase-like protein
MAPDLEERVPREILEALIEEGTEAFRKVLEKLLNLAMGVERSEFLGAEPYERTRQRRGHANGYKDKKIATRVGELELKIPQVRGLSFYPQSLEKGCRSEKALKLAVAEMYVMGVSTRKVSEITEQLCGTEISATQVSRVASLLDEELEKFRSRPLLGEYPFVYLDAHYEKVRVDGRVQDLAILKAIGVHACGHREVLGVSARLSEAEVHWRAFLDDLASRGLKGVELLVSDDHAGLRAARRAVFPAVPWQRCQFHLSQNAQRFARRNQERRRIAQALRDIFNSPSLEDAEAMLKRKVQAFGETNQALSQWMEENVREGLTVHTFARGLHKRIRTVNALENLNKQIRRRTRVVGIFPHEASALRLISAVMAEIHDEWITGRRYLNLEDREEKEDLVPQPV